MGCMYYTSNSGKTAGDNVVLNSVTRVVLPICGGNIDTTLLGRCLERGLAADGRLVTFSVTVSDRYYISTSKSLVSDR
jgi:hypothetical protein